MNIIRTSNKTMSAAELYSMCKSNSIQKLSDAAGQTIEVAAYLFYEDANSDGEIKTICSIKTPEGEVLATNSPTFVREFGDMIDMFETAGEQVKAIKIVQGTSKGGRSFITCDIA